MTRRCRAAAVLIMILAGSGTAAARSYGWVEEGRIHPENIAVQAKLDTGALTSSMHAEALEFFQRDGAPWIRFTVGLEDPATGARRNATFERRHIRTVEVRGAGGAERRPVVQMTICIGDALYEQQFSLNDRTDMTYPVLIGRRALQQMGPVDVSRMFTVEPDCPRGMQGRGDPAAAAIARMR